MDPPGTLSQTSTKGGPSSRVPGLRAVEAGQVEAGQVEGELFLDRTERQRTLSRCTRLAMLLTSNTFPA